MAPTTFHSDPCWDAYPNTVIEIGALASLRIDLRLHVGPEQHSALKRLGLAGCFAVVTACNPRGLRLSTDENAHRNRRLSAQLEAEQVVSLRADGVCADGSHRESGFALAIGQASAVRIATAYEQSAIFWFDGARFRILPVLETGATAVTLPLNDNAGITL